MFSGIPNLVQLSVRPSINTYCAWRDISVLSGWISIKLTDSSCEWELLRMFSRAQVKG